MSLKSVPWVNIKQAAWMFTNLKAEKPWPDKIEYGVLTENYFVAWRS
jgi:hypothetical protein